MDTKVADLSRRWRHALPTGSALSSVAFHTLLFALALILPTAGYTDWDKALLVLTTLVSLEAIYLAIFIQLSLNHAKESLKEVEADVEDIQENVAEIQEDIDEIQEDVIEMSEEERSDQKRKEDQREALVSIQEDLEKLLADIDRFKNQQSP